MLGNLRLAAIVTGLGLGLGACSIDSVTAGPDGNDHNTLGRLCSSSLKTSGTFAIGMAQPADVNGCWPVGMWTFTAQIDSSKPSSCAPAPTFLPQYQLKVDYTTDGNGDPIDTYSFPTDPSAHAILKVTEGGSGLCAGEVDVYSPDGKQVWNLRPELNADGSITGDGEYDLYDSDQWM